MLKKLEITDAAKYRIVAGEDLDDPEHIGELVRFGETASIDIDGDYYEATIDANGECNGLLTHADGNTEPIAFELSCEIEE